MSIGGRYDRANTGGGVTCLEVRCTLRHGSAYLLYGSSLRTTQDVAAVRQQLRQLNEKRIRDSSSFCSCAVGVLLYYVELLQALSSARELAPEYGKVVKNCVVFRAVAVRYEHRQSSRRCRALCV